MTKRLASRALVAFALPLAMPASGAASTGGASASDQEAHIASIRCVAVGSALCPNRTQAPTGARIQIVGQGLQGAREVVFRGGRGSRDDIVVRARHVRPTHVDATVPRRARTGHLELRSSRGRQAVSRSRLRVVAAPQAAPTAVPAAGPQVFPIRGPHNLGASATNNFGGGRGHQGQDLLSPCGTPVVAAEGGAVKFVGTEGRAGNYAVITGASGRDFVYMHLEAEPDLTKGQQVLVGQPFGATGRTGNATACMLHFELWAKPGWYTGGAAVDPLPDLTAWDALDGPHAHRQ